MALLWVLAVAGLAQLCGASPNLAMVPAASSTPPVGSPVALHGKLSVQGNKIVDEHGEAVQFKGMSFFWSQWEPEFWNAQAVDYLVDDWKCTLVRAAMAVEHGGYLENPDQEKAKVKAVVDGAIAKGIYVIIDWHDHHAEDHVDEAKAFFAEMAQLYGQEPSVLFETYNEPLQISWADVVKPYHEQLVAEIRQHANESIIILGTTTWSQDVDTASADPVAGSNLAYTLHFYAATHKGGLRDKAVVAMDNGAALVVTEWGTCDASGNGTLDLESSREWIAFLDDHNISHANWAVSDKLEAASALWPGAAGTGGWEDSDYTPSGYYIRKMIMGEDNGEECRLPEQWPCLKPECAIGWSACMEELCCDDPTQQCFNKDSGWSQCLEECGQDRIDDGWSCNVLTPPEDGAQALWPGVLLLLLAVTSSSL